MISNETMTFEESPLTVRPGIVVGYRVNGKPIYNVAGGAADLDVSDDSDDDDDSTADDDADDSGVHPDDAWVPPTKDDWLKLQADKRKADSESAARKRFLRDNGFDPKTGQPIQKPSVQLDDDDASDATVADGNTDAKPAFDREKLEKNFQRQLERETQKAEGSGRKAAYSLISEVPAALETAGWNGKNLTRMIKLLDLDAVEIDADGVDADALDAQVAELKRDFPEFFKRARMREAAKEVADTGVAGGGKKKAPASEEDLDWKTRMRNQILQGG
jgi:hypothetical protein